LRPWEEIAREIFHPAEMERLYVATPEEREWLISAREGFIDGCIDWLELDRDEIIERIMEQGDLVAEGLATDWLPPDLRKDLEDVSP